MSYGTAKVPDGLSTLHKFELEAMATDVEVLIGAGEISQARELKAKMLSKDSSEQARAVLREHIARAGNAAFTAE